MINKKPITKKYLKVYRALYSDKLNTAPTAILKSTPTKGINKKRKSPERSLVHLPLMKWASLHPVCKTRLIHIPNERKCSPHQGHMLRMLGVKAGVSDLFLAYPNNGYHGYFLELKAPGKKPTAAQQDWLDRMAHVGYMAEWFDDWVKAKDSIEEYLC